ncbi:glycerate kinase [Rhodococcus sp. NPDC003318]|uniref:glycerate kinase n=1 Tax=Rhodococcus sp. NPDC003318 TaxID=3364503 RepID=UPI0036A7908A
MRVLIAPDSFGDTLTAVEAADAIAAGWKHGRPDDVLVRAPQSDGGPGFVDVLAVRGGDVLDVTVAGPLSDPVRARWLRVGDVAYIESAQACGLHLLGRDPDPESAVTAHSAGVGELVAAAVAAGATTVVVGLGGSGCTDGGRGLVTGLTGAAPDPDALRTARDRLAGIRLIAATDVENPLLGPRGAAAVFGPQKGADPATVDRLEGRNAAWATVLDSFAGQPVSRAAGAGAAGGLGAALLALGARRRSGADIVAELTEQDALLRSVDAVVTGEGRFDHQSLGGKVAVAVARAAHAQGVPALVLAGQVALDRADPDLVALALRGVHSVSDHAGSVRVAMDDAARQLAGLAEVVAQRW